MALFKPSPLLAAISGTIGGMNFATSSKRPIVRLAQRRPAGQATSLVSERARFAYIQRLWQRQSKATQDSWRTFASSDRWRDRLGQARTPSGFQLFAWCAIPLLQSAQTFDPTLIPKPIQITVTTPNVLSYAVGTQLQIQINTSIGSPTVPLSLYAQTFYRPMTAYLPSSGSVPTRQLPQRWRFLMWADWTVGATVNISAQIAALIGAPISGQAVAIRSRFVLTQFYNQWVEDSIKARA